MKLFVGDQWQDGIKNIGRMQVQRSQCKTPEYTPEYILTLNPKNFALT